MSSKLQRRVIVTLTAVESQQARGGWVAVVTLQFGRINSMIQATKMGGFGHGSSPVLLTDVL